MALADPRMCLVSTMVPDHPAMPWSVGQVLCMHRSTPVYI